MHIVCQLFYIYCAIHIPVSHFFWPSRQNFEDTELQFCIFLIANSDKNFKAILQRGSFVTDIKTVTVLCFQKQRLMLILKYCFLLASYR